MAYLNVYLPIVGLCRMIMNLILTLIWCVTLNEGKQLASSRYSNPIGIIAIAYPIILRRDSVMRRSKLMTNYKHIVCILNKT